MGWRRLANAIHKCMWHRLIVRKRPQERLVYVYQQTRLVSQNTSQNNAMGVTLGVVQSTNVASVAHSVCAQLTARPSLIPSLCTHSTRAGIEWRR